MGAALCGHASSRRPLERRIVPRVVDRSDTSNDFLEAEDFVGGRSSVSRGLVHHVEEHELAGFRTLVLVQTDEETLEKLERIVRLGSKHAIAAKVANSGPERRNPDFCCRAAASV